MKRAISIMIIALACVPIAFAAEGDILAACLEDADATYSWCLTNGGSCEKLYEDMSAMRILVNRT